MAGRSAALTFLRLARALEAAAGEQGLRVPAFRSPPRLAGADRTLRRSPSGHVTVAVRLRGRRPRAVKTDMIEGVVVANRLRGRAAVECREALWRALDGSETRSPAAGDRPRRS